MKNRSIYIVVSILTLVLGITVVWFYYQYNFPKTQTDVPRFLYMSGSLDCRQLNYRFQSSTEPKVYGADCVFCRELGRDIGNIGVYRASISAEDTQSIFTNYSTNEIVEKSTKVDKNGSKIGDKTTWIVRNENQIDTAVIMWTEKNDFWKIDAPTLELVKEFEESETFKTVKAEIDSACVSK